MLDYMCTLCKECSLYDVSKFPNPNIEMRRCRVPKLVNRDICGWVMASCSTEKRKGMVSCSAWPPLSPWKVANLTCH